jgi:16S rRNA (cytosine967-C5)-methyltransferase
VAKQKTAALIRAEAAKAVEAILGGRSMDAALAAVSDAVPLRDRALVHVMVYGCIRNHWRLRAVVRSLLQKPLKSRDQIIATLLAIGIYQMQSMRIPDHAVVSATVEAARRLRHPQHAGLVNAVLRNFRRQGEPALEQATDEEIYNHPDWLLQRLRNDWPDEWHEIVAANNEQAPMWLRVNALQATPAQYVAALAADGIEASVVDALPQAVRLSEPVLVDDLPGFSDGLVSVQDGAAQIAAAWLAARPGMRVLDACAAPGGKTGHLLELAANDLDLTAIDSDPTRLLRVQESLDRLKLSANLLVGDAKLSAEWWDGRPFDRILIDAPCSATGVIRRHPDIKLLRKDTDIAVLAKLQGEILQNLWQLLAPGGRLLYVTCSVLEEENSAVIANFLRHHPEAGTHKELRNYNIHDVMRARRFGYQILPGTDGLDGFFFACFDKP